jgi:hypothetical protein
MAAKADEYRHYAQECLEAVSRVHGRAQHPLHIARTWQRLADQEEDGFRTPAEHPTAHPHQQVQPDEDKK